MKLYGNLTILVVSTCRSPSWRVRETLLSATRVCVYVWSHFSWISLLKIIIHLYMEFCALLFKCVRFSWIVVSHLNCWHHTRDQRLFPPHQAELASFTIPPRTQLAHHIHHTSQHNEQSVFRQNHCNHALKTRLLNDMILQNTMSKECFDKTTATTCWKHAF